VPGNPIPPVAILCGGRGTRLQEDLPTVPKPLAEIGGKPILWHVINIFLAQGFRRFLLLSGYKADLIAEFAARGPWPPHTNVECLETGLDTPTGGRLRQARDRLGDGRFCVTYADGVADVDLAALLATHERGATRATMTVVRPELPFGVTELNGDGRVRGFVEKPRSERWINGGFFCFEPSVLEILDEDVPLEGEPLERLAAAGELHAFRHEGFWACMDTYKDSILLNDLWAAGSAPWKLWS
jgi:glucose-1-phosphate cytidylyltransferase